MSGDDEETNVPSGNHPNPTPWHRQHRWIVGSLIVLPPLGWALTGLMKDWSVRKRGVAIVLSVLWFIVALASWSHPSEPTNVAAPPVTTTTTETAPTTAAAATVPNFFRSTLDDAKERAINEGLDSATSHDASDGDRDQWADGNWKVCFQRPAAGGQISDLGTVAIDFGVVRNEETCPKTDGAPIPRPSTPDIVEEPAPQVPEPTTNYDPAPPADDVDTYYANCTQARAAGVAPLHPGEPGYSLKLDRDHDGEACED